MLIADWSIIPNPQQFREKPAKRRIGAEHPVGVRQSR
jgi:hypothetical protein